LIESESFFDEVMYEEIALGVKEKDANVIPMASPKEKSITGLFLSKGI